MVIVRMFLPGLTQSKYCFVLTECLFILYSIVLVVCDVCFYAFVFACCNKIVPLMDNKDSLT